MVYEIATGYQLGVGLDSVVRPSRRASLHAPHPRQRRAGGEKFAEERRLHASAPISRQAGRHSGRGFHG